MIGIERDGCGFLRRLVLLKKKRRLNEVVLIFGRVFSLEKSRKGRRFC